MTPEDKEEITQKLNKLYDHFGNHYKMLHQITANGDGGFSYSVEQIPTASLEIRYNVSVTCWKHTPRERSITKHVNVSRPLLQGFDRTPQEDYDRYVSGAIIEMYRLLLEADKRTNGISG